METGEDLLKRRDGETCSACRFFLGIAGVKTYTGPCRRYPPVFEPRGDNSEYDFPYTRADAWCGEWKPVNELG